MTQDVLLIRRRKSDYQDNISIGVDIAKSIAIIMVVIGHYHPYNPTYWSILTKFGYTFHVALFMFLSGFLFAKSQKPYAATLKDKTLRLMLPYATATVVLFTLKCLSYVAVGTENPVNKDLAYHILINPCGGFNDLLWFLYVLMEIFIIFPILLRIFRNDLLLIIVTVSLSMFQWPHEFALDRFFIYLPIFTCGYIIQKHFSRHHIRKYLLAGSLGYAAFIVLYAGGLVESVVLLRIIRVLLGLSGSIMMFSLSIILSKQLKLSAHIGRSSMSIFLYHTIAFAPIHILFFKIGRLGESWFLPSAVIACSMAIALPMIFERCLSKMQVSSLMFFGSSIKPRAWSENDLRPQNI